MLLVSGVDGGVLMFQYHGERQTAFEWRRKNSTVDTQYIRYDEKKESEIKSNKKESLPDLLQLCLNELSKQFFISIVQQVNESKI